MLPFVEPRVSEGVEEAELVAALERIARTLEALGLVLVAILLALVVLAAGG